MITEKVTKKQLAAWKALYLQKRDTLQSNRITGAQLDRWFRETYHPAPLEHSGFLEVMAANAAEQAQTQAAPDIACYLVEDTILVGIDRTTGFFQVECEDISRAEPLWDALFLRRGLSDQDLSNYVLTALYLELKDNRGGEV